MVTPDLDLDFAEYRQYRHTEKLQIYHISFTNTNVFYYCLLFEWIYISTFSFLILIFPLIFHGTTMTPYCVKQHCSSTMRWASLIPSPGQTQAIGCQQHTLTTASLVVPIWLPHFVLTHITSIDASRSGEFFCVIMTITIYGSFLYNRVTSYLSPIGLSSVLV